MRLSPILLLAFTILSCNDNSHSTLIVDQIVTNQNTKLKEEINRTINDSVQAKSLDKYISSCDGAELWGYYSQLKIVKIKLTIGMSMGITDKEYYFKNDSLIYVNEKFQGFAMTKEGDLLRDSFDIYFNGHYYFKHDSVVRIKSLGHNRFENDSIDIEKTLLQEAYQHRSILTSKTNP